jgi:hypothetical protein
MSRSAGATAFDLMLGRYQLPPSDPTVADLRELLQAEHMR